MNGPFKTGEIVEFVNITPGFELVGISNGDECEVVGRLQTYLCRNFYSGALYPVLGYQVTSAVGTHVVEPEYLRRKKPPQTFTGEQRIRELFTPAPVTELEPA